MSYFFKICFSDCFDKCIYRFIFYDADCATAKSAACDTGTENTRNLPCKVYKDINLFTGYIIIITQ